MTTTPSGKTKVMPTVLGIVGVLVVIGLVTGKDDDSTNSSPDTPAIEEVVEAPTGDTPQLAVPPAAPADVAPADVAPADVAAAVVPNVVGLDHQLAQDTLQASGFYLLLEEDATGQDRMLLQDRNWEVVSQSVAGGTTATIDTIITLYSKKSGE